MSTCPYCKTQDYKIQYPTYDIFDNHYEIALCKQCRAYFLTPNPSEELLNIAYDDSYYGGSETEEKFEGFVEKGLSFFRKQRAKHVFGLLGKKTSSKAKVLDIGCGNGQFLDSIQSIADIDIYGIEMPGSSAKRAFKIENINGVIHVLNAPSPAATACLAIADEIVSQALSVSTNSNTKTDEGECCYHKKE